MPIHARIRQGNQSIILSYHWSSCVWDDFGLAKSKHILFQKGNSNNSSKIYFLVVEKTILRNLDEVAQSSPTWTTKIVFPVSFLRLLTHLVWTSAQLWHFCHIFNSYNTSSIVALKFLNGLRWEMKRIHPSDAISLCPLVYISVIQMALMV